MWYRDFGAFRQSVAEAFTRVTDSEAVTRLIVNAIDLLYRRFIRMVMSADNPSPAKGRLRDLALALVQQRLCDGHILWGRLCPKKIIKTQIVDQQAKARQIANAKGSKKAIDAIEADPPKKPWKEMVSDSPHINGQVMTEQEFALVKKANAALLRIEKDPRLGLQFDPDRDSNPVEWTRHVRHKLGSLQARTEIVNAHLRERKSDVRQFLMTKLRQEIDEGTLPPLKAGETVFDRINVENWASCAKWYLTHCDATQERTGILVGCLNRLFFPSVGRSLDGWEKVTSDELRSSLVALL
jgi:hypothetical protein